MNNNNFKEKVRNQNSTTSEKNDSSDYCKECNEYYYVIKKKERVWIKYSVYEWWPQENCTIFSKTRNNHSEYLEKRMKSTKKHEGVPQWWRI